MDRVSSTSGAGSRGNAVLTGDTLASDFSTRNTLIGQGEITCSVENGSCTVHRNASYYLRFQNLIRLHLDVTLQFTAESANVPMRSVQIALPEAIRAAAGYQHATSGSIYHSDSRTHRTCEVSIGSASGVVQMHVAHGIPHAVILDLASDIYYVPFYGVFQASIL